MGDRKTYVFNGARFWRLNDEKDESERGYPKAVCSTWMDVPDDIDEIFVWGHNWKTYFFTGHQYYRYDDALNQVEANYPKNITVGWPVFTAGFTWSNYKATFSKMTKCTYLITSMIRSPLDTPN